jgi:hypothetical protein
MTEIELWEQEIEKSNRFNLFEETNRIVDYLSESIKLDCEMVESGILTEGAGDIAVKFKLMLQKIKSALANIITRIKVFIRDKIQAFKQNHIVDKFKKGKIDEEKMANKLNKTNLFDPQVVKDAFDIGVAILNGSKELGSIIADNDKLSKKLGKHAEILGFTRAEEMERDGKKVSKSLGIEHEEESFVRINPKNAKAEIISLYEKTTDCLDDFNNKVKEFERDIDGMMNQIKDVKNQIKDSNDKEEAKRHKEDINHLKAEATYVSGLCKATMRISKKFLQQANTLQAIMVAFSGSDGEAEEVKES